MVRLLIYWLGMLGHCDSIVRNRTLNGISCSGSDMGVGAMVGTITLGSEEDVRLGYI